MTTLNELEQLARAVYAPNKDDWELKQALLNFDRAANPETILRLISLVREMAEALEKSRCGSNLKEEALAKYKEVK